MLPNSTYTPQHTPLNKTTRPTPSAYFDLDVVEQKFRPLSTPSTVAIDGSSSPTTSKEISPYREGSEHSGAAELELHLPIVFDTNQENSVTVLEHDEYTCEDQF
jgi:hypothetical protein